MNDQTNESARGTAGHALSNDAAARRRLLLKSLGKGGAVVAAASPLASFAAPVLLPTQDGTLCSVSGFKSSLASRAPVGTVYCAGYAPGHYIDATTGNVQNWPAAALLPTTSFASLFSGGSTDSLQVILRDRPNSDEAFVIAAYLYAYHLELGHTAPAAYPTGTAAWPYNARSYIVNYWNDTTISARAIEFYRLVLATN